MNELMFSVKVKSHNAIKPNQRSATTSAVGKDQPAAISLPGGGASVMTKLGGGAVDSGRSPLLSLSLDSHTMGTCHCWPGNFGRSFLNFTPSL